MIGWLVDATLWCVVRAWSLVGRKYLFQGISAELVSFFSSVSSWSSIHSTLSYRVISAWLKRGGNGTFVRWNWSMVIFITDDILLLPRLISGLRLFLLIKITIVFHEISWNNLPKNNINELVTNRFLLYK